MAIETDYSTTTSQIIAAAEKMSADELNALVNRMLEIQAARRAPHLSLEESALLKQINLTLPEREQLRLRELQAKRMSEDLSNSEYEILAKLSDKLEVLHAKRIEAISKLADIRGISLIEAMKQLNIKLPDHG